MVKTTMDSIRPGAESPAARWVLPAIAAAVVLVFARTLNYPLLDAWDDATYVRANPFLELSWANIWRFLRAPYFHMYHPLTMFSYMLDYNLWGLRGLGYRLQNLFWHLAAVAAVWRRLRHWRIDWRPAALLLLVFAVHPQRVESVAWVGERKDVLCAAFYLWALYAYIAATGARGRWLSLGLFVAALLSKPTAVSLPFVLIVWEWYRGTPWRTTLRRLGGWVLLAVAFMVLATHAQGSAIDARIDPVRQLGVVLHNVLWYPWRMLWPGAVNPLYPRLSPTPLRVGAVIAGYLLVATGLARLWRQRGWRGVRPVVAGIAAYGFIMAPMIGIVPYALIDYADRYSYLPHVLLLLGIGILLECLLPAWPARARRLALAGGLAYALVLGILAWQYGPVWRSTRTIMTAAAAHDPANPEAIVELAQRDYQAARTAPPGDRRLLYDRVHANANRLEQLDNVGLGPGYLRGYRVLGAWYRGLVLLETGRPAAALAALETVLPHAGSRQGIGREAVLSKVAKAAIGAGQYDRAIEVTTALLADEPDSYEAHVLRGVAHAELGDRDAALTDFAAAIRIAPDRPEAPANRQRLLDAGTGTD